MTKIISTSRTFGKYADDPIDILRESGYEVDFATNVETEDQMIEVLKGAQVLVVGVEPVTKKVIEASTDLKIIAKHGAGVDNIDLKAAKAANITVINAPGANRHAVADYVIGLMLNARRGINKASEQLQNKKWQIFIGNELYHKTIGVIGTGRIGSEVIRRASGFDMDILAYDLYINKDLQSTYGVEYTSLENVLQKSDYITLHTELTDETKNLIGIEELNMMKQNATLINTSRGGIINEEELFKFMQQNKDFFAALDVFEKEPFTENPLLSLSNFLGTPHMAGYSKEALTEVGIITANNIINILQGKEAKYVVN